MHHISRRQLLFLTATSIIGRGIFTVPREALATGIGPGVWMIILANGVLLSIAIWALVAVGSRFPGQTAPEYSEILLGKPLGKFITLIILATFLIQVTFALRTFIEVIQLTLLRQTPISASSAVMILVVVYLAAQRLEIIARGGELIVPLMLALYVYILLVASRHVDPVNLRPFLSLEGSFLRSVHTNASVFFGAQTLWITVAFLRVQKGAIAYGIGGGLLVTVTYILMTLLTVGTLGVEHTVQLAWPSFDAIQAGTPVGSVFERLGSLLVIVWISITLFSLALHLHAAGVTIAHWLGFPEVNLYIPIVPTAALIAVLSVMLFPDSIVLFDTIQRSTTLGWILLYMLPLLLWSVAHIRDLPRSDQ